MIVRLSPAVKWLRRACLACLAVLAAGCASRQPERRQQFLLGTICAVTIYDRASAADFAAAFEAVAEVEARMSVTLPESEVSRVNAKAGVAPVAVSRETYDVIREGLAFAAPTGGAFDITVGPLVALWGIGTDAARIPADDEVRAALALLGASEVRLDDAALTVFLPRSGMRLDLGGIAKGHAADRAAAALRARGIGSALLDFGGNIVAVGKHPSRPSWRIGIQDPDRARGTYLGIVAVADTAVVTSGTYERFFERDGVRYHHILDTTTGRPASNGVVSTTVVCASSTTADALSTSLFALGPERGLSLARATPGVEAMVITEDRRIHLTEGLRPLLTVTDSSYTLAEE